MLRIYRKHGEKIRCRGGAGEHCGTFTVINCTPEMRQIYGADVVVRFESVKMAVTYIAVTPHRWSNYGKCAMRVTSRGNVEFLFFSAPEDCEIIRCEMLDTWYKDVR